MKFLQRFRKSPSGPSHPRLFFLGLDGTPHTLLESLAADGVMPNYARILAQGSSAPMTSTLPDISSVAWSTWMTGTNPGQHGVYGFTDLKPSTYKMYFPNFQHLAGDTTWDILGKAGRRSIILNVPGTYPAKPLNGMLVSGFVAIDLAKATYPSAHVEKLRSIGYKTDVDARKAADGWDLFFEELHDVLRGRRDAILHFLKTEEWEFFTAAITGTDRLQHFLWQAYSRPDHPHHGDFLDYYRAVDAVIGEIDAHLGPDFPLVVMSDHGFTDLTHEVYLNVWLEEAGFLQWEKPAGEREMTDLSAIASTSRAFCMDPGRVYIHRRGRYPKGSVAPEDVDSIAEEIAKGLQGIVDSGHGGAPVIREIHRKDETYSGAHFAQAPDLVCMPHDGYDLKGSIRETSLFGNKLFTGMHQRNGAHVYVRGHEIQKSDPNIVDVLPTILHLLEIDAPANLDGSSLV